MTGWAPARFRIATVDGVPSVDGFARAGLGVHLTGRDEAGRPVWTVTHLASGGTVARIGGDEVDAMGAADELLALDDWLFAARATAPAGLRERVRRWQRHTRFRILHVAGDQPAALRRLARERAAAIRAGQGASG